MVVQRTALSVLLLVCSIGGAAFMLRLESRRSAHDRPARRAERLVTATLVGVGIGMSVATLILFAAAVTVRLQG